MLNQSLIVSFAKLEQNPKSNYKEMTFFKTQGLSTAFVEIILPPKPIILLKCYYFCSATEKISLPLETPKYYSKDLRIFLTGSNPVTNGDPEIKYSLINNGNIINVTQKPYMKGGVMIMAKKTTSKKVATKASKILRDDRYSKASKSVAGSALSQREK